jgi:hypothetical protein
MSQCILKSCDRLFMQTQTSPPIARPFGSNGIRDLNMNELRPIEIGDVLLDQFDTDWILIGIGRDRFGSAIYQFKSAVTRQLTDWQPATNVYHMFVKLKLAPVLSSERVLISLS